MEQTHNTKTIVVAILVLLILGGVYMFFEKKGFKSTGEDRGSTATNKEQATVVVENTPVSNGTMKAPTGFPADIPVESSAIVESATTRYPESATQLSLSYESSKTVSEKYKEYITYMKQAGYEVTEGDANSPVKAIFGIKGDSNLTVAVSNTSGKVLVQISYLLKTS